MADTNSTFKFQYGLLYVSLEVETGQAGDKVYLHSCSANQLCFQEAYEFMETPESQGLHFLGELNRNKQMSGTYADIHEDYIARKNIYIVVVRTSTVGEGDEATTSYQVIKRYESPTDFTIELESRDYGMSLDKDENDRLVTANGINIAISRPASTAIFEDSEFTYKLNLYRLPWGEFSKSKIYHAGDIVFYNDTLYRASTNMPYAGIYPGTTVGSGWKEYDPFPTTYAGWGRTTQYFYGDIVSYRGGLYRLTAASSIEQEPFGMVTSSVWAPYMSGVYGAIDGQTLVKSVTLTANDPSEILDTITQFAPNRHYTYVLTIHAEQPKTNNPLDGGEYFCSMAIGRAASCLLFDAAVTDSGIGELCVVDEEENIVSTQNSAPSQSYPRAEQAQDNDWITFGIMPNESRCLNVVAFESNEAGRRRFVEWLDGAGAAVEYTYLGYAKIPEVIQHYNSVISGTIQMRLDKVDDITYTLNLPDTQYTGEPIVIPSEGYGVTNLSDPSISVLYALKDPDTGEYDEYMSSIMVGPDVGTYEIKVKLNLGDYAEDEQEGTLIITPAPITGITLTGGGDFIYGETRQVTVGGTENGDEVLYSVNGGEYSATNPTFTDAGTYTIAVKVHRDDNYRDYQNTVIIGISPADISGITLDRWEGIYDGQPHTITVNGTEDGDEILYSTDGVTYNLTESPAYTEVGQSTVYVKVHRDSNHNDWTGNTTVRITAKTIITTITLAPYNGTYDGEAHSIAVNGLEQNDIVVYSEDGTNYNLNANPGYSTVGTYTVYVKVSRTNCEDWIGSANVVISPAEIDNVVVSGATVTYDADPHSITVNAQNGDVVSYSTDAGDNKTYTSENPEFSNAGTYTVFVKVEREGYTDWTGRAVLTINKAALNLEFSANDKVYDGGNSASVSYIGPTGLVGSDSVSVTNVSGTFGNKNVGTDKDVTVSYNISGADNYNVSTNTPTASITAKTVSVTGTTVQNKTYNGNTTANVILGTVSGIVAGDDATMTVSALFPASNVGDYDVTVTYTLSGNDASNYTYTNQESVSASITPATITNITLTRWEGDYDGSAHRITVSGTSTGDTVLYSSDGENYSGTNPSFTEAGTYTVYVKVNRANYNEWTGSAQVVINAVAQIVWYTGIIPKPYIDQTRSWHTNPYASNINNLPITSNDGKDLQTIITDLQGKYRYNGTHANGDSLLFSYDTVETGELDGNGNYTDCDSYHDWYQALCRTGVNPDRIEDYYETYEGYPFVLTNQDTAIVVKNGNSETMDFTKVITEITIDGTVLHGILRTSVAAGDNFIGMTFANE